MKLAPLRLWAHLNYIACSGIWVSSVACTPHAFMTSCVTLCSNSLGYIPLSCCSEFWEIFWKTLVSPSSGSYMTFPVFSWLFSGPFLWRQRLEGCRPSCGGLSKWVLEALFWPLLVLVWHFLSWRDLAWHNIFWPETCNLQFAPAHRRPVS